MTPVGSVAAWCVVNTSALLSYAVCWAAAGTLAALAVPGSEAVVAVVSAVPLTAAAAWASAVRRHGATLLTREIRRRGVTPSAASRLAELPNADVRAAVASHAGTPPDVLLWLLSDQRVHVAAAAAHNPRMPAEGFDRVLTTWNDVVWAAAAGNPACPESTLMAFADFGRMADHVLNAPSCTIAVMERMLRTRAGREAVAACPTAPDSLRSFAAIGMEPS